MVSLEQVKLLETKVTKTIDYVKKVTEENTLLKKKLNSCQQRIDELEVLIKQFKDDQGRIEDTILSALDRLNQFEDALENKLKSDENPDNPSPKDPPAKVEPAELQNPVKPQQIDNELDIF